MGTLNILWLDDLRNPEDYLYRKAPKQPSAAFIRNREFYDMLKSQYDMKFSWVRNIREFQDYIIKNGIPDFVSFDHDLGKGEAKGAECARWLKEYCAINGIAFPKWFAHSANANGRNAIKSILLPENKQKKIRLTEEQFKQYISYISESVYMNNLNAKKKQINLAYNKNGDSRSPGNIAPMDKLKTNKMDNGLGNDTYEVPLKGGVMSYNITSIQGEVVMHYFKNFFKNKKTEEEFQGEKYEIIMQNEEFRNFMNNFKTKVNNVINYRIGEIKKANPKEEIVGVSIYPVPSSSNFNTEMAKIMATLNLCSLPAQVINQDLLKKDLRNLSRDEEFIEKNKEFFNGKKSNRLAGSVSSHIDTNIDREKTLRRLEPYINKINEYEDLILRSYYSYNHTKSKATLNNILKYYKMYHDLYAECCKMATYNNYAKGGISKINSDQIAEPIKYSKGPSIEVRSHAIWQFIKPFLRGVKSPISGLPYKEMPIQQWKFLDFQIKTLSNGERMGLKNIYNPNVDAELVQQELEKIKGTVFVIFDDNISGGATLSDICYQCKEMGITNIIPITFGQMAEKWQMGPMMLNKPVNDQGEVGKFNL